MTRKFRILIVDDDKLNVRLLVELFRDDYDISTAHSGVEALEVVTVFNPDIILLDIMMPGMNGYEVCKKIREKPEYAYTKILLLSAKSLLEDRLEGYEAGANDYITKPFEPEEIKAKLSIFLQLKYSDEVNRLKDDLLMLQSHETKTPLNAILGFAELLSKSENLNVEEKQFTQYILESGRELLQNTKKTLLLCQLTKGIELHVSSAPLASIAKECIQNLSKQFEEKNININFDQQIEGIAYFDIQLVNTAVLYILENAIKFTPDNCNITLHLTQNDKEVTLHISDEGTGINQDDINSVFNPFVKENIWTHDKGLGISLAISRNIALLHGGDVIVENLSPKGARFSFSLSRSLSKSRNSATN